MGKMWIAALVLSQFCVQVFPARLGDIEWQPVETSLKLNRDLPLNDFESGTTSPWFDESAADAKWNIETFGTFNDSVLAPQPSVGTKYLRVRRPPGTSGQAVLRSDFFNAAPGDQFSMSFWIRSQILQTSNLEVYWVNAEGRLERLLSLVQYSTPTNFEWRVANVTIPATEVLQTRLSIFGFCYSGDVDGVAIDNLAVVASGQTIAPTTLSTAGTSTTTTTVTPPTTPLPGNCPSNLGPNQVKCEVLDGKCYCFSLYKVDSWASGDTYCRSNGASLLSLETQAETVLINNYITSTTSGLDQYAYWTSGQWLGSGFVWTGAGNQPLFYTNWYTGQPDDNAPGFCIRLFYGTDYNGRWSDIKCSGEGYLPFYFICELLVIKLASNAF